MPKRRGEFSGPEHFPTWVKHHQPEVLATATFGGWSIELEMATHSELLEANLQEALMRANVISSFYMWLRV